MSRGEDVIDFSWGEPDFDTPSTVKEACKSALDSNLTHYSSSRGVSQLRKDICLKLKTEYGLDYLWSENIILRENQKVLHREETESNLSQNGSFPQDSQQSTIQM